MTSSKMSKVPEQVIPVLDGRHELVLLGVSMKPDSFTVKYSITPPLPDDPMVYLWLEATDDAGNVYTNWGGACGPSPDGRQTLGSVTGQPALPSSARSLAVRLSFMQGTQVSRYEVSLPLHPRD
jgi:hypothetical protein